MNQGHLSLSYDPLTCLLHLIVWEGLTFAEVSWSPPDKSTILFCHSALNHSSPFPSKGAASASNTDVWKCHCQCITASLVPHCHHTRLQISWDQLFIDKLMQHIAMCRPLQPIPLPSHPLGSHASCLQQHGKHV